MGRQYMRQSFSSASCAAGDSPCASSTTLQCVVANTAALFSHLRPVGSIPLPEAPPSSADTGAIQVKIHLKIKIASGQAPIQVGFKPIAVQFNLLGKSPGRRGGHV